MSLNGEVEPEPEKVQRPVKPVKAKKKQEEVLVEVSSFSQNIICPIFNSKTGPFSAKSKVFLQFPTKFFFGLR